MKFIEIKKGEGSKFNPAIKDGAMVLFFSDRCGHCTNMKPDWIALKEKINELQQELQCEENNKITCPNIVSVNVEAMPELDKKWHKYSGSVPTILAVRKNGEIVVFNHERNTNNFMNFMKEHLTPYRKKSSRKLSGHKRSGHNRSGHNRSGHNRSGHKQSGHKRSGHKRSGHKRSGHKRSGHKRSGHKRSGHKRSGRKRSGRNARGQYQYESFIIGGGKKKSRRKHAKTRRISKARKNSRKKRRTYRVKK